LEIKQQKQWFKNIKINKKQRRLKAKLKVKNWNFSWEIPFF